MHDWETSLDDDKDDHVLILIFVSLVVDDIVHEILGILIENCLI